LTLRIKFGIIKCNKYIMDKPIEDYQKLVEDQIEKKQDKIKNGNLCCRQKRQVQHSIKLLRSDLRPAIEGCWLQNSFKPPMTYARFNRLSNIEQFNYILKEGFLREDCKKFTESDREDYIKNGLHLCCRDWDSLKNKIKKI